MERVYLNPSKFLQFIENLNPQNSGILFSIFLHLIILLFAVGLPNFFDTKNIYVPSIIPVEIINVSEKTNIQKTNKNTDINENKKNITKQKKFNSSENTEIKKNLNIEENNKNIINFSKEKKIEIKEKEQLVTKSNNMVQLKEKENKVINNEFESNQQTNKTYIKNRLGFKKN